MKNFSKLFNKFFTLIIQKNISTSKYKNELFLSDTLINYNELKPLYKSLIKKCHPDRFNDNERKNIAEELTKQINVNRYNYKALNEINKKVIDLLH
jgi:DnaJ-class molecular chaperone